MDSYVVYVLWSRSADRFYVGSAADLQNRLREHNTSQSKATRYGIPWVVVHHETFATRAEAVRRERYFKTGKGRDELRGVLGSLA